jgi:hypothetical protein
MGGQRARGLFAMVGGSAVACAAALIVVTSPVPEKAGNACALVPSYQGCTPPLGTGSGAGGFHSNVTTSTVIPQDTQAALPNQIALPNQ